MTTSLSFSEHDWLASLPPQLGDATTATLVGIGDDAAVISPPPCPLLLTVDAAMEGVHFARNLLSLEDIGYRSLMAAASDIAAMGGTLRAVLSAITVPPAFSSSELNTLVAGQTRAANELCTSIVGGNLSAGPCLSVTTTVVGESINAPLRRGGCHAGDGVYLWGAPGQAATGLRALQTERAGASAAIDQCVQAWRRPRAWIEPCRRIASLASAAIDVSDGLAQDAGHVARASKLRLVLDDALIQHAAGRTVHEAGEQLRLPSRQIALTGGEDYALLVTSAHDLCPYGWARIGYAESGTAEVVILRDGRRCVPPAGYDHGAT